MFVKLVIVLLSPAALPSSMAPTPIAYAEQAGYACPLLNHSFPDAATLINPDLLKVPSGRGASPVGPDGQFVELCCTASPKLMLTAAML